MITVHEVEQGSPEWHALRDKVYTGTGAEKLLNYSGQVKIVDGVVSAYALTEITGFGGNFYTRRGHALEDEAIDLYQQITGHEVIRPGFVTNSRYPQCGYSPDGFCVTCNMPLEVKAFNRDKHLQLVDAKDVLDIPAKITSQIHWGQFIWEKRGGKLLPYNPYFAKRLIDGEYGQEPNPDYNPAKAFKVIPIKYNRNIINNFKRVVKAACNVPTATKI